MDTKVQLLPTVVRADIEIALKRRATVDGQVIAVEVSIADLTLTGTVHRWAERELVTRWGSDTSGVRHVVAWMDLVA